MSQSPPLPLTTEQLPVQRLVEVVDLPSVPSAFSPTVCLFWRPDDILPKRRPRHMTYLGTVEWSWAPWSSRIESYWLHRARGHWIVWMQDRDWTNDPEYRWQVAAYVARDGITAEQAAPHLIVARWSEERDDRDLEQFHFISGTGAIAVEEWMAIGRAVWGAAASGD
jgi:hypothetical protein